jgi:hypothetical protein
MFKTDEEIQNIVVDAKAYLYETTQQIGFALSNYAANDLYNSTLNTANVSVNLIKGIEFIGATENNKLSDRLQRLINTPSMQKNYVEEGYVTQGYVKSNQ